MGLSGKGGFNAGDAFADPAHDRDGHGIAASLVARSVGALVFGFALPADATPVVREALETLALDWGETPDGHSADERDVASARSELGGDRRGYIKRTCDAGVLRMIFVDAWLHDGMGRPGIPKVEVVQRVAAIGQHPSLIIGD